MKREAQLQRIIPSFVWQTSRVFTFILYSDIRGASYCIKIKIVHTVTLIYFNCFLTGRYNFDGLSLLASINKAPYTKSLNKYFSKEVYFIMSNTTDLPMQNAITDMIIMMSLNLTCSRFAVDMYYESARKTERSPYTVVSVIISR